MEELRLKEKFIKLGQALKACGLVDSGAEAKLAVLDGKVKVNGKTEIHRGKKLYAGDTVIYQNKTVKIVENDH